MIPTVLILHTLRWPNAARLALAFRDVDCRVRAICPRAHPLRRLAAVEQVYTYEPLRPLRSFQAAIEAADPDLVVPCDDWAVRLLHRLYARAPGPPGSPSRLQAVIRASLGRPDGYGLVTARSRLGEIAAATGVLLPRTEPVSRIGQLDDWMRHEGFPAVIKREHSSGGTGVMIVGSLPEAKLAFRQMTGCHNLVQAAKQLLRNRDSEMAFDTLHGAGGVLSLQRFISGKPANCAAACWEGEVIASIEVEVVASKGPTGQATIVRIIDNQDMLATVRRIVSQLGISGFCGFDFILENNTMKSYLLEINPRATQINHLVLRTGGDLVAVLSAHAGHTPLRERPVITERDTIALFPQVWGRDCEDELVAGAYRDLPHDAQGLVDAYLEGPRREGGVSRAAPCGGKTH